MKVRDIFFEEINKKIVSGEDIVIVSADIGAPSLDNLRRNFPNRFINVGIAEQNLLSVASGLQLAGKKVITYGLNPFPVTRAFDQIRNLMASLQIPITVTALNAGSCSADAGYTHMAVENVSLMRTLKNIQVVNPSDAVMTRKLVEEVLHHPVPRYIQFDKEIEGELYQENEISFSKGFVCKQKRSDIVVISYGIIANELMRKDVQAKIIDCFALPIDADSLLDEIKGCKRVITIEDAVITGGLGSMILEILNDHNWSIPVERIGLTFSNGYPDIFLNRGILWEKEGLRITDIVERIK